MTKPRWTLYFIVLSGFLLLMVQLDRRSLWVDEMLTLQMIQGTPQDAVAASIADLHPPLYLLLAQTWTALAGSSDFALRWLSVAAGVIGLALMPGLARRLIEPRAALAATLMLAAAPAFAEFSRMGRYYSLTLMLGLLSTHLLLNAIDRGKWIDWAAYMLSGLALVYTFYPAGILLMAHAFIVLPIRTRAATRRWLISAAVVGAGFVPWLMAVAGRQIGQVAGGAGADLARSALGFALGMATSFYTFSVGETIFPWHPAAWIGLLIAAALILIGLWRARARWPLAGIFLASIAFTSAVTTFVSVGTPFLNVPVRALFVLPFYLLLAAGGLTAITSAKRQAAVMIVVLIVWGIGRVNDFTDQQFLNPIYITPAKESAAYVRALATDPDLVISDYDSVFSRYFLPGGSMPQHVYSHEAAKIEAALKARPRRVWLITIGRDQTARNSNADQVRERLTAYRLDRIERLLPIDPIYLRLKETLLRRDSYANRLTIELYALQP